MLPLPYRQPDPPTPTNPAEAARWTQTRLRRRLLDGVWHRDLNARVVEMLGQIRRNATGPLDLSANPFRVINRERATLYLRPPEVRAEDGDADISGLVGTAGSVTAAGLWPAMSRFQAWTLGCREYLMRVHATPEGLLRYRSVPPDMVLAGASLDVPDVPVVVQELRLRADPKPGAPPIWTWDYQDISDPDRPVYQIRAAELDASMGADLTSQYQPEHTATGDLWPAEWRTADGEPVLTYVLYHAENLGDRLFDAFDERSLVEGSLTTAALLSLFLHVTVDASWPQRWALGARPQGLETTDPDGNAVRQEVVTDPATILILERINDELQPQIGQFQPGGDPVQMLTAIEAYAARLASDAGVSGSDMQRMSGDPRSGYAISLSADGKRQQQRRYSESFRLSDQRLMALSATLLNRLAGTDYPETGYAILYREIPLSPDERKSRRDDVFERLDRKMIKRVDAYRALNPGLSEAQAAADLAEIDGAGPAEAPADGTPATPETATATPDAPNAPSPATEDVASADESVAASSVEPLNGAQVTAAKAIILDVAMGLLPRASGVAMLIDFFGIPPGRAESMMGSVGRTFFVTEPKPDAPNA